jgi:hypothetical protein
MVMTTPCKNCGIGIVFKDGRWLHHKIYTDSKGGTTYHYEHCLSTTKAEPETQLLTEGVG